MKLLILGGTEFVGKELVRQAIVENHEITIISLTKPDSHENVEWLQVDRNNLTDLEDVLSNKNFDTIIDNIAYNSSQVRKLIKAIGSRARRYVLTSSVDIYEHNLLKKADEIDDEKLLEHYVTENTAKFKRYLIGKRSAEIELRNDIVIAEKVILRPCVVCGTNDNIFSYNKIKVPRSLFWPAKILDNQPVIILSTDTSIFSLVHVVDVAKAQLLVAGHPEAANKIFNVVGDNVYSTESFLTRLIFYSNRKNEIISNYNYHQLKNLSFFNADGQLYFHTPWSWKKPNGNTIHRNSIFNNSRLKELGWVPTDEKSMMLSLFDDQEKIKSTVLQMQDTRTQEIILANKILNIQEKKNFIPGYCTKKLSKVGIGTFRGKNSDEDDKLYYNSISSCILNGINVIDTAINYRNMASEKIIGKVINDLVVNKKISRDELFVITKGGFTGSGYAYSGHENNKIKHSINPGFIKHSYETSYSNLQLETIDLYLLHNPELALQHHNRTDFYELLLENFIFLENEVFKGRIKGYGIATWEGLICKPHNLPFIQLSKVLELVQIAANGKKHHFIGIELPINIHAHKAFTLKNQFYKGEYLTALEFAALHDIRIFSSASILYGKDTQDIDIYFNTDEALTVPQKSLYFVKSLPQVSCAIVNLRQENHVQAAIDVNNYNDLPMEKITFTINQSTFRRPQIILK